MINGLRLPFFPGKLQTTAKLLVITVLFLRFVGNYVLILLILEMKSNVEFVEYFHHIKHNDRKDGAPDNTGNTTSKIFWYDF